MLHSRRDFLGITLAGPSIAPLSPRWLDALEARLARLGGRTDAGAAGDEDFWEEIRRAFPHHADYIHLENGYASPQPTPTFAAFSADERAINGGLSFYMRRKWADDYAAAKADLAALAGVPADEITITRNTTESLGTVIHGLDLAEGDEVIACSQDYGSMLQQFGQQSRRRGIRVVEVDVPLHPASDDDIVGVYERAMTARTRLVLVSHMINITGQVLPVRKISAMVHAHGAEVIVDAAHSFAHLDFRIPDLDGDYLGSSLHKWLSAPVGAGLLHIRKERIARVWPLLGDTAAASDDIRKFEHLGTRPPWDVRAIRDAIRFHNMIGSARKEARLRFLQGHWTDRVRGVHGITLNTPEGARACGIANVRVDGMTPLELEKALFDRFGIYTVAIDTGPVKGVRVTPHLFTTTVELDRLVAALRELAGA